MPGPKGWKGSCDECLCAVFRDDGTVLRKRTTQLERGIRLRNECPHCKRAELKNYEPSYLTQKYLDLFGMCCDGFGGVSSPPETGGWYEQPIDIYLAFGIIRTIMNGANDKNKS